MHSKSDYIENMINDEVDEIIEKKIWIIQKKYQKNLESIKANEFAFDYVHLMYCICYKNIRIMVDDIYTDSPEWIKNKKATVNSINKKDNKYFQYAIIDALN